MQLMRNDPVILAHLFGQKISLFKLSKNIFNFLIFLPGLKSR